MHCIADFNLIPVGTDSASINEHICAVKKILDECPKVEYKMHAYGTNIEGEWKDVMEAIEKCHTVLHSKHNVKRINTDLRITTRTDKELKHHLVVSVKRVEETVGVPQHLEE